MFIAYVCHATMHTNCLISHILIPRFLWVFDLYVLAQFFVHELLFLIQLPEESHFKKTLQSFSGFSCNVELVHTFTPLKAEAHTELYIIP